MNNPFKEEMTALHLEQMKGADEKICAIYTFLKNKVRWNEKYALYSKSPKQVLKEGTGSNADINFILISMLKRCRNTRLSGSNEPPGYGHTSL